MDPTSAQRRAELEAQIRAAAEAGDINGAARQALEGFGPELLGYLHGISRDAADADDAFATVCERVWRGLSDFRWTSSCRTWMYTIARNAGIDLLRAAARRRARVVPLDEASEVERIAQRIRTTTEVHLKTETKNELERIRAKLPPDDRSLLILRLDRQMTWPEIATVLADGDLAPDDVAGAAARQRKRFARLKARITSMLGPAD